MERSRSSLKLTKRTHESRLERTKLARGEIENLQRGHTKEDTQGARESTKEKKNYLGAASGAVARSKDGHAWGRLPETWRIPGA